MAPASPNRPPKFSGQYMGSALHYPRPQVFPPLPTAGDPPAEAIRPVEPAPAPELQDDDRPVASPPPTGRRGSRPEWFDTLAPAADAREDEPGAVLLDVWHASYTDWAAVPEARRLLEQARAKAAGAVARPLFPGIEDDRKVVPADGAPPWHGVCSLTVTAADGSRWAGTGWLAGPRTVVTAGHCVYLTRHGGWARRVEVRAPGQDTPQASADFRSVAGWVETLLASADYGAVILPEPVPGPYRRPEVAPDELFARASVCVVGYCTDQPPGTLWAQERVVREVQPRRLMYDRPAFGGVSGGPVLPLEGEDPGVVAVQQSGCFEGGAAVRVSEAVRANISDWVNRPDDRPPELSVAAKVGFSLTISR